MTCAAVWTVFQSRAKYNSEKNEVDYLYTRQQDYNGSHVNSTPVNRKNRDMIDKNLEDATKEDMERERK
ncbi:hypothetical protein CHS0354_042786 [Potamilus streckersoni]|uniref:Uncharacterized protein n=1 Tax=Potamilus streckersoni TaxID=2493646 RepID=A0AAE0W7Y9_9BIVA|nr:hypothetical protein CHS0354_042786 [Potamilus streckersoni]